MPAISLSALFTMYTHTPQTQPQHTAYRVHLVHALLSAPFRLVSVLNFTVVEHSSRWGEYKSFESLRALAVKRMSE